MVAAAVAATSCKHNPNSSARSRSHPDVTDGNSVHHHKKLVEGIAKVLELELDVQLYLHVKETV